MHHYQSFCQAHMLNNIHNNLHICPSSSTSSQNNSRSSSHSQSMSPISSRARSSSVTGFYNIGNNNSSGVRRASIQKRRNCSGSKKPINEDYRYPVAVSNYDDSDQPSPNVSTNLPQTYSIDWSDVNALELDFVVYKTLPNIRKHLNPNECYYMEKNPRGQCLIINNEHFYDQNKKELLNFRRHGTDMDASRLKNLYDKLNFQVDMCVDLTEREMRHKISSFANDCEFNSANYDAICLIVLSHGTDGYVYGIDFENRINMDKDILSLFDDILIGKPKLFIFQACRGGNFIFHFFKFL